MGSEMHGSYKFCAFSNSTIPINIDGFVVFQPLQFARFWKYVQYFELTWDIYG